MTNNIVTIQRTLFILFFILCGITLDAQDAGKMKNLDFMKGTWEGTGWRMTQTGKEYTGILEKVACKVDCSVLMVDGLGTKTDSVTMQKKIVHEAFGVIYFDKLHSKWMMKAFTKYGVADTEIEFLEDKKISWTLTVPGNIIVKYITDFSTGKWVETGDMTRDGKSWTRIMEMSLTKTQ